MVNHSNGSVVLGGRVVASADPRGPSATLRREKIMTLTRRSAFSGAAVAGLMLAAAAAEAQQPHPKDRHPKIRQAIRALQAAKDDMQHADHDFGGHRVDALKACDDAIRQLRIALQYADK